MREFWNITKQTVSEFIEDRAMVNAAALAFYMIFSLGPVLLIVVVIVGAVYSESAAQGQVEQQFANALGPAVAQQAQQLINNAQRTGGGTIATIVGIVMLLLAATVVFSQLKDSLNVIWGVQPKPGRSVVGFVVTRLLAFAVVLLIAALLLAMIAATTAIAAVSGWIERYIAIPAWVVQAVELVVTFGILTVLFAMIFKWLPDVRIAWRNVWLGAAVTAVLFEIGKLALGWYLGRGSTTSVYGAAGSLVAILLFVYYSAIIFLLGAEFTQVYARRSGSRIEPAKYAQWRPGEAPAAGPMEAKAQAGVARSSTRGRDELEGREHMAIDRAKAPRTDSLAAQIRRGIARGLHESQR